MTSLDSAYMRFVRIICTDLRANEPDAILFVFGDQGAGQSRGVDV